VTTMHAFEAFLTQFDDPSYARLAVQRAGEFKNATPFPHIVIDNFLLYSQPLAAEYPRQDAAWTVHANPNVGRQFQGDETHYRPLFRAFAQSVNTRRFLLFLETLTGIEGLLGDPYFVGGGAMSAGRGDHLAVHCDFNWHYKLHMHRRLNALFYLTPDWKAQWGGELLLTNDDRTVERTCLPLFNRLIVFKVTDHSWHGQPNKLMCPENVRRNVFSAFYYTAATDEQINDPHLTKYRDETPYTAAPLNNYKASGGM